MIQTYWGYIEMENKFCIVIPDFNHKEKIGEMIERLFQLNHRCLIVNDASNFETRSVLEKLDCDYDNLSLLHHVENQGKGGALISGFNWAKDNGFTHVIQIDADGQHDIEDMYKFIEMANENKNSLILGKPIYDDRIPKMRQYGRYITHFWVWLETISFDIKDSMCGYRVYPLKEVLPIINRINLGQRMDFDIEICVRLHWAGLSIKTIATKIVYHEDEISNFKMLRDNWDISKLHTKLCFGSILRSPILIFRKCFGNRNKVSHWSNIGERGSLLGISILIWIYRIIGRSMTIFFMFPVIMYFYITGKSARCASHEYLENLYDSTKIKNEKTVLNRRPGFFERFYHFYEFGISGLDKFVGWFGKIPKEKIDWDNRKEILDLAQQKKGGLLLGAHLGNMEVLRAVADSNERIKINALAYTDHAQKFNSLLKSINENVDFELISISDFNPGTAIALKEKIDQGEFIAIMGDRVSDVSKEKNSAVQFLGKDAYFPQGPFILASLLKCPVFTIFCIRTKGSFYKVYLDKFSDQLSFPRKDREESIKLAIQKYVYRLEEICNKYPYQWFAFYNFWKKTV